MIRSRWRMLNILVKIPITCIDQLTIEVPAMLSLGLSKLQLVDSVWSTSRKRTKRIDAVASVAAGFDPLADEIRRWWDMETYATFVVYPDAQKRRRALEILERSTKLKDGRYEVGLLWSSDKPSISNNYGSALVSLGHLNFDLVRIPI